jgi:hypothetical protein
MRTSALIGRSFGRLLMRGSVIRNAERTTNGTKQHYDPCVVDDSAGCVSYQCPATSPSPRRVRSAYIGRDVRPHHESRENDVQGRAEADVRNMRQGKQIPSVGCVLCVMQCMVTASEKQRCACCACQVLGIDPKAIHC